MITFKLDIRDPKNITERIIIENRDKTTVWISRGDGEYGEFSIQGLYDVLNKFYNDNF